MMNEIVSIYLNILMTIILLGGITIGLIIELIITIWLLFGILIGLLGTISIIYEILNKMFMIFIMDNY